MANYDDLLEDDPESGAFDADLDPIGFEPDQLEESNVVSVEPKIIQIGRNRKKREMSDLQEPPSEVERSH